MRVDNVKVTMDIPVHFNQPDNNGHVYTKESWEEAVNGDENIIKVFDVLNYGGTFEEVKLM